MDQYKLGYSIYVEQIYNRNNFLREAPYAAEAAQRNSKKKTKKKKNNNNNNKYFKKKKNYDLGVTQNRTYQNWTTTGLPIVAQQVKNLT